MEYATEMWGDYYCYTQRAHSYNHDGKADWTQEMWPQVLGIKEFLNPNNKALPQDYLLIERKEKLLFIRPLFVGSIAFLMLFGVLLRDA